MNPPPETFTSIIAIIVTYNSGEELRDNLPAILPQVQKLILVDNSTEQSTVQLLKHLDEQYETIEVIYNNKNIGLGAAQNIGIRKAVADGADWVLLLDDDSTPDAAMVATLQSAYADHPQPEKVGLLAARIVDVHSGRRYPCLKMHSRWWVTREDMDSVPVIDDALLAMASGSLIRVEMLKKIGLMREDFFIDFIDWEFALRLRAEGWRIATVRDAVLNHRLGAQKNHRFLGRNWITTNYPPFRRYTTAKNRILFWRVMGRRLPIGCFGYQCISWGYEALVILLFEKNKFTKFGAMLKGAWAGIITAAPNRQAPLL